MPGGYVYHVLNRAFARLPLFQKAGDYDAFERVLHEALQEYPTRLLAYCVLPNHWRLAVWPERDGDLTAFVGWLTHTHAMRCHAHYRTSGTSHLYQGRFKAFAVAADDHFYAVMRYVERNPLRANLAPAAADWRWSSLWRRCQSDPPARALLAAWPLPEPADWRDWGQQPQTEAELTAVRRALTRGQPFGPPAWAGG